MRRAKHLSLSQYCNLVTDQVRSIRDAQDNGVPVTSLDSIYNCPITWNDGSKFYTIHHGRQYKR